MTSTITSLNAIEREVRIAATPETIFGFFTDPDKIVEWLGRRAEVKAEPGGIFRIDYNGFDIMRGSFVEVVPHSRVVFTWGWETLNDGTQPGASTVEITLTPDGDGTILHLLHTGLSALDADLHAQGWDSLLPELAKWAQGEAAPPVRTPLSAGEEFASRLNSLLVELRWAIEGCSEAGWKATCPGSGWSVGVTAAHAASHGGLAHFAKAVAAGQRAPQADYTLDRLAEQNATAAREHAAMTPERVLSTLKSDGPVAVEVVKALSDADLAKTQSMVFAGGAELSARQLLEGPMLSDLAAHLADIRAAG
jgi:uncharacterized protein YndB with AHSA1/START domain